MLARCQRLQLLLPNSALCQCHPKLLASNFTTFFHHRTSLPSSFLPMLLSYSYPRWCRSLHHLGGRNQRREEAVPSPLSAVARREREPAGEREVLPKPAVVQAVLKRIPQSPRKVNLVAEMVRGMLVEDALLQMQVAVKRAARVVYQVIRSARANASHNYGLDPERLIIDEAFVGKGVYLKKIAYHAKGRSGIIENKRCRLTIRVRELTPDEESTIARIKARKARKLTKKEKRLVPHVLIETAPVADRKVRKQLGLAP